MGGVRRVRFRVRANCLVRRNRVGDAPDTDGTAVLATHFVLHERVGFEGDEHPSRLCFMFQARRKVDRKWCSEAAFLWASRSVMVLILL